MREEHKTERTRGWQAASSRHVLSCTGACHSGSAALSLLAVSAAATEPVGWEDTFRESTTEYGWVLKEHRAETGQRAAYKSEVVPRDGNSLSSPVRRFTESQRFQPFISLILHGRLTYECNKTGSVMLSYTLMIGYQELTVSAKPTYGNWSVAQQS